MVLLGFLFISYIIYIRIFRNTIAKEFSITLYQTGQWITISVYLIIIITMLLRFIYSIKVLNQDKKPIQNIILQKILLFLQPINQSMQTFHTWLLDNTILGNYMYNFSKTLGLCLKMHLDTKTKMLLFPIFLIIIPKFFVLLSLTIDVVYFHKFNLVYKFSILLLLPLIERYFYYIIEEFCATNCIHNDDNLIIILFDNENTILFCKEYLEELIFMRIEPSQVRFKFTKSFIKKYKNTKVDLAKSLDFNVNRLHEELLPIKSFEIFYKIFQDEKILLFHVILYGFYSLIWTYILWYSF